MSAAQQELTNAFAGSVERLDTTGELLTRVVGGDEAAFAELYELTSRRVYGLVLRVTRCPHHAAEVTQEVYLDVWQQAARHDPNRGSVLTWMTTIAHRRAVDRVRSVAATQSRDHRHAARQPNDRDNVWESVAIRADAARVRLALVTLSAKQQQALELAYFQGRTQSQIAQQLHIPLGTVKTRIRNGLTTLRNTLLPD